MQRSRPSSYFESEVTLFDDSLDQEEFKNVTVNWLAKNCTLIISRSIDAYRVWSGPGYVYVGPLTREVANRIIPIGRELEKKKAEKLIARIDETVDDSYLVYRNFFPFVATIPMKIRIQRAQREVNVFFTNEAPIERFSSFMYRVSRSQVPTEMPEFLILKKNATWLYRLFLEQHLHGIGPCGLNGVYYVQKGGVPSFHLLPIESNLLGVVPVDFGSSSIDSFFFADSISKSLRSIWSVALGTFGETNFLKRCKIVSSDEGVEGRKANLCTSYSEVMVEPEKDRGGTFLENIEMWLDVEKSTIPDDIFVKPISLGKVQAENIFYYDRQDKSMKISSSINPKRVKEMFVEASKPLRKLEGTASAEKGGMEEVGSEIFTFSSDPLDRTKKFFTLGSMLNCFVIYMRKSETENALYALTEIWRLQEIGKKTIPQILNCISSVAVKDLNPDDKSSRKLTSYVVNFSNAFNNHSKNNASFIEVINLVDQICEADKARPHCIVDYQKGRVLTKVDKKQLVALEKTVSAKDPQLAKKVSQISNAFELKSSDEKSEYIEFFNMICYKLYEKSEDCYTWLNYYFSTNELETGYITMNDNQLTGLDILLDVICYLSKRDLSTVKLFYRRRNYYYVVYLIYCFMNGYGEDPIDISQKIEDIEMGKEIISDLKSGKYKLFPEEFLLYKTHKDVATRLAYWKTTFTNPDDNPYYTDVDAMNKDNTYN